MKRLLLILLLCLPHQAWATTYTPIANDSIGGTANSAVTAGMNTTGADLLNCAVVWDSGVDVTTVEFTDSKSNTWTRGTVYLATNVKIAFFTSSPTTVGSAHTFQVSLTGSFSSIICTAWSGSAASPLDQATGNTVNGGGTILPGSTTPTQDNELVVTAVGHASAGTESIDSGMTLLTGQLDLSGGNHYGLAYAYIIQTTKTTINPVWTHTGALSNLSSPIDSFKVSGGAPPAVAHGLLLRGVQ